MKAVPAPSPARCVCSRRRPCQAVQCPALRSRLHAAAAAQQQKWDITKSEPKLMPQGDLQHMTHRASRYHNDTPQPPSTATALHTTWSDIAQPKALHAQQPPTATLMPPHASIMWGSAAGSMLCTAMDAVRVRTLRAARRVALHLRLEGLHLVRQLHRSRHSLRTAFTVTLDKYSTHANLRADSEYITQTCERSLCMHSATSDGNIPAEVFFCMGIPAQLGRYERSL